MNMFKLLSGSVYYELEIMMHMGKNIAMLN